jgi:plastocyanin
MSDMKHISIVAAICMLAVFPLMTHAETYQVSVRDTIFEPNNLVIHPGDTVVWTDRRQTVNCGGYGGCAEVVLHTVSADDQSFSSGEPADDWAFQQTFDEPGEILYHCAVHSSPGKDLNDFMNGRITVQGVEEQVFLINAAMSDAWFFPDTAGQGFFIIVWENQKLIFLAWFTYDTERPPEDVMANLGEPGHRWLTALGPYDGDSALLDVFLSSGMIFDSGTPEVTTEQLEDATIWITWSSCEEGVLTYNIPSLELSGDIPIQRIVDDNVAACEAAQAQ